jgi:hypothetical protein
MTTPEDDERRLTPAERDRIISGELYAWATDQFPEISITPAQMYTWAMQDGNDCERCLFPMVGHEPCGDRFYCAPSGCWLAADLTPITQAEADGWENEAMHSK